MRGCFLLALLVLALGATTACGNPPAPSPMPALGSPAPVASSPDSSPEEGKALAARFGCAACHSADASPSVGPTWKGLSGREEVLADGSQVLVDGAYLREAILTPNAKVVEGFLPSLMPQDFGVRLSDQQVQAIIAYIETLQ